MKRVLVIDDHDYSRMHVIALLNETGYKVAAEGASGKLALVIARAAVPDIILMDIPKLPVLEMARCFDLEPRRNLRVSQRRSKAWPLWK